jgi:hypothetical protein
VRLLSPLFFSPFLFTYAPCAGQQQPCAPPPERRCDLRPLPARNACTPFSQISRKNKFGFGTWGKLRDGTEPHGNLRRPPRVLAALRCRRCVSFSLSCACPLRWFPLCTALFAPPAFRAALTYGAVLPSLLTSYGGWRDGELRSCCQLRVDCPSITVVYQINRLLKRKFSSFSSTNAQVTFDTPEGSRVPWHPSAILSRALPHSAIDFSPARSWQWRLFVVNLIG